VALISEPAGGVIVYDVVDSAEVLALVTVVAAYQITATEIAPALATASSGFVF
jgi:hypothetical protein